MVVVFLVRFSSAAEEKGERVWGESNENRTKQEKQIDEEKNFNGIDPDGTAAVGEIRKLTAAAGSSCRIEQLDGSRSRRLGRCAALVRCRNKDFVENKCEV